MGETVRGVLRWVAIAAWVASHGCGKPKERGPAEHFEGILEHLRQGSLAGAYEAFMPDSYHRDLEGAWERVKALVTEAELQELRGFAEETGARIADALEARGDSLPLLARLATGLRDVPGLLGLRDYEAFREQTIPGLLSSIDRGLFRELAATEAVRSRLAGVTVSLRETRGQWAKLRFSMVDPDGGLSTEDHDMIRVDGKWVFNSWAVDWPEVVRAWNVALDDLEREKAENPAILTDSLTTARTLASSGDTLVVELLRRLGVLEP